jgi:NTP pyrophosphatase (non-canonical NTP hydrolase)
MVMEPDDYIYERAHENADRPVMFGNIQQIKLEVPIVEPENTMTLDEYQKAASRTSNWVPGGGMNGLPDGVYSVLGLTGEAGEVAEKTKKYIRDGLGYHETRLAIEKELGDVLWYLSETARQWDLSLGRVAKTNLDKLASREARGVIHGSGDDR